MEQERPQEPGRTEKPEEPGATLPPDAEDEGYDEGTGDRITPEDEQDVEGPEGTTSQTPASSSRHLPEDMPP